MSPSERKTMVRKDHTVLSLTRQCKLLKISRSSLYYRPVGFDEETLKLMNEIDRVLPSIRFSAVVKSQHICPETDFVLAVIHCPTVVCLQAMRGACAD